MAGLNAAMGWDKPPPQGTTLDWADRLGRGLSNNLADASIKSALGQGKLEDNLKGAIVGAVGASLANAVGDLSSGDTAALNSFGNKVAHALVGCGMGAAIEGGSKGCAAGALGAVVAEATAELYNAGGTVKPFTKEIGQITAIVAAAVAGQDVDVAQLAGSNAVTNNFLKHTEAAQMRREFEACKAKTGGCTQTETDALVKKYINLSNNNIAAVQACVMAGDQACVTKLESQAATVSEVSGILPLGYGDVERIFINRQNQALDGRVVATGSTGNDAQAARQVTVARQQLCAGLSASACDQKIIALKGEGQKAALALLGTGLAIGITPELIAGAQAGAQLLVNAGKWTVGELKLMKEIGIKAYCTINYTGCAAAVEVAACTAAGQGCPPISTVPSVTRGTTANSGKVVKPTIVTPKGVAVAPETLAKQGTSNLAGNFKGLEGATVDDIVARVPSDWRMAPQDRGVGVKFLDSQGYERLRIHGPSGNAPVGSNSASGWTMRIMDRAGNYYDDLGNIVPYKANSGHIPIYGNAVLGVKP